MERAGAAQDTSRLLSAARTKLGGDNPSGAEEGGDRRKEHFGFTKNIQKKKKEKKGKAGTEQGEREIKDVLILYDS